MIRALFHAFLLLATLTAGAADWSSVPVRDNRGMVLIRTNWVDKDGPQSGIATGFVVSSTGYILSVAHQVPTDSTSVVLHTGETESWPSAYPRQTFPLKLEKIDRLGDWAVFVPTKPVQLTPVPVSWTWAPAEGEAVNTRGFPLGGPLEGMPGSVRRSGQSPEVPLSMLLRAGYSGSPVYNTAGQAVCMVRGGTAVADVSDSTVMGLGFCVSLGLLKPKIPAELVASASTPSAQTPAPSGEVRISYSVSITKETPFEGLQDLGRPSTTQHYSPRFAAQPGYKIVKYDYIEHSATKVSNLKVEVSPDGQFLEVDFDLTSGPGHSRWRGWLTATLTTTQVPKEAK